MSEENRVNKTLRLKEKMSEIDQIAMDNYEREKILNEFDSAYQRIRNNPDEWKEVLEERALWDTTLMDGLSEISPNKPGAGASRLPR